MKNIKDENRLLNPSFVLLLITYLALGILLQRYYRYEGFNANTIGYFSVALEYSRGNLKNAINGFYPPLISWLLVPFVKLGLHPLPAMRIINLITGLFLLIGVKKLSYRFDISENVRNVILISSVPIILYYTTSLFPDLLSLCFLVYYMNIMFNYKYTVSIYNGILCGILGSFAYFSKNYAFPFFIAHFLLFNALHLLKITGKIEWKNVLRNAAVGILVFSVISGVWVYLISSKYGFFTFGTAGDYMSKLLGPDVRADYKFEEAQEDDPVYWAGLLKPPHETAFSVWDDPSYVINKFYDKKAKLTSAPKYLIKRVIKNSLIVIKTIFVKYFSFLSIPIIIAYILFFIQPIDKLLSRGDILYPSVTIVLFSLGLTPFVVNVDNIRYFWLDNILLLLMGGKVLTVLFNTEFFTAKRKNLLIFFFIFSFILMPLRDIIQKPTRGDENHALSEKLLSEYNIQGKVASNDNWGFTLELVYRLNTNNKTGNRVYYYGMPKKGQAHDEILNELKTHDIDYYFVWGDSGFLPEFEEITGGKLLNLKIYSLKVAK